MEPERRRRYLIDIPGGEEEEPSVRAPRPTPTPPGRRIKFISRGKSELTEIAASLSIENMRDFYNHLLVGSGIPPRNAMDMASGPIEDIAAELGRLISELPTAARVSEETQFVYVNYMVDEDEPLGGLEWDDIAKIELEQQLEVITERRSYDYYERLGAIALETASGEANNGESEWIVFENEDKAEEAAVDRVRDDLGENPEIFTQSWLEGFINEEAFKRFLREDATSLAYDLDENDLIDSGYLEETDDEGEVIVHTEREIDEARERWADDDVEQKARGGPIAFFREIYGRDEAAQEAIRACGIDINEAAQDAVDTDGIAHFLDVYDGDAVELPSGAYAYGTN